MSGVSLYHASSVLCSWCTMTVPSVSRKAAPAPEPGNGLAMVVQDWALANKPSKHNDKAIPANERKAETFTIAFSLSFFLGVDGRALPTISGNYRLTGCAERKQFCVESN